MYLEIGRTKAYILVMNLNSNVVRFFFNSFTHSSMLWIVSSALAFRPSISWWESVFGRCENGFYGNPKPYRNSDGPQPRRWLIFTSKLSRGKYFHRKDSTMMSCGSDMRMKMTYSISNKHHKTPHGHSRSHVIHDKLHFITNFFSAPNDSMMYYSEMPCTVRAANISLIIDLFFCWNALSALAGICFWNFSYVTQCAHSSFFNRSVLIPFWSRVRCEPKQFSLEAAVIKENAREKTINFRYVFRPKQRQRWNDGRKYSWNRRSSPHIHSIAYVMCDVRMRKRVNNPSHVYSQSD